MATRTLSWYSLGGDASKVPRYAGLGGSSGRGGEAGPGFSSLEVGWLFLTDLEALKKKD
jgi:hypothetical protein